MAWKLLERRFQSEQRWEGTGVKPDRWANFYLNGQPATMRSLEVRGRSQSPAQETSRKKSRARIVENRKRSMHHRALRDTNNAPEGHRSRAKSVLNSRRHSKHPSPPDSRRLMAPGGSKSPSAISTMSRSLNTVAPPPVVAPPPPSLFIDDKDPFCELPPSTDVGRPESEVVMRDRLLF